MRLSRRARLGLVFFLCLSAGLAGWRAYRATEPAVPGDAAVRTSTAAAAPTLPDEVQPAIVEEVPPPVLSPVVRDLAALADAGDAHAACQLGTLFSACRWAGFMNFPDETIDDLRRQESRFAASGDLLAANRSARMLLLAENHRRYCRDLPPAYLRRAPRYLRQAALAGNRRAQVSYLRGDGFMLNGAADGSDFNSADFRLWRKEAVGMLQALFREGRPEAVLLLLEGHSYQGSNLSMIVPPDPARDLAYLHLARHLFSDFQLPDHWQQAPVDSRAEADGKAMAKQWHAEYFASRQLSIDEDLLDYPHPFQPEAEPEVPTLDEWKSTCRVADEGSP